MDDVRMNADVMSVRAISSSWGQPKRSSHPLNPPDSGLRPSFASILEGQLTLAFCWQSLQCLLASIQWSRRARAQRLKRYPRLGVSWALVRRAYVGMSPAISVTKLRDKATRGSLTKPANSRALESSSIDSEDAFILDQSTHCVVGLDVDAGLRRYCGCGGQGVVVTLCLGRVEMSRVDVCDRGVCFVMPSLSSLLLCFIAVDVEMQ